MARKSKTQKAKASAARQERKAARKLEETNVESGENLTQASAGEDAKSELAKKEAKADKPAKKDESESKKVAKKSETAKPKKKRFQFFRDVKAELKRVTWPTRIDVLRWSGVVVAALIFFGVFIAILDNLIVTPLLVLISGADPSSIDWLSWMTNADISAGGDGSSADSSVSTNSTTMEISSNDLSGAETDASSVPDSGSAEGTDGGTDAASDSKGE